MTGLMTQTGNETPTFADILREAIRENQLEVNTMIPGVVVSYDALIQTCEVQPSLKRTIINPASVISRPRLKDVPVIFPRTSTGGVFFRLKAGDKVAIVFSQRSLDDWNESSGEVQVRDTRLHDVTDAVVFPGLYQAMDPISPIQADGTELRGDTIFLGKTGTSDEPLVLGNVLQTNLENLISSVEDLVALIASGAVIGTTTVATLGVPAPVSSVLVTTGVTADLLSVKSALPGQNSDFIFGEKG